MSKNLPKLVRDKIPDIIRSTGSTCQVDHVSDRLKIISLLKDKLIEEAHEVDWAGIDDKNLLAELADVQEVVDTLLKLQNWTRDDLLIIQEAKRTANGGFSGIVLISYTAGINKS
jgi:predicted house-cleaning noncanonical NTP pyrophosphatase (MazG superfamily)